ncbi:hypothetical protein SAMN05444159_4888 [Bradyrhizobium lablabi]|uniref:Uncharacterized protein n=1 Tax=Bradyrhizobium lablabi TaxID=722472 RepID=A0A1M6XJJ2_9BRAD|nr:hypothetical protein [Bradyrhizobium lablabi]SHL06137.1 hypothetical protein SAMN05444159_4888 [Bradyrhizobium lablabi]
MIKALSAIAISAFIAAAVFILPGFAPQVEAGAPVALQKSSRLVIHTVDRGCTKQTWPNFSAPCLHGNGAKLEPRFVSADRG